MAISNIKAALQRKYRTWLGERGQLLKEIAKIEKAQLELEGKRGRVEQVDRLLEAARTIMAEVAPAWDPDKESPAQTHQLSLPMEPGENTRLCLDILREAPDPMRMWHITLEIADRKGFDREDKELIDRVRRAVDGALRGLYKRKIVDRTGDWPGLWFIVQHGDRPEA